MKRSIHLILFMTFFSAGASAFSMKDLIKLATSSPAKTMEEIIALLPQEYRDNYALMYKSESLQSASHEKPRIIFYGGKDKSLTFAISGNPSGHDADSAIEAFEFDQKTGKYNFQEIMVKPGKVSVTHGAATKCMSCHKASLRPIWGKFDLWPGVIGSRQRDHTDPPFAQDLEHLKKLNATTMNTGVYQYLKKYDPYVYLDLSSARTMQDRFNHDNFKRIAMEITAMPEYPRHRYAIYAALTNYGNNIEDFFSDQEKNGKKSFNEVLADTKNKLGIHHEKIIAKEAKARGIAPPTAQEIYQKNQFANWDLHFFHDKADVGENLDTREKKERNLYKMARARYVFEEILGKKINHWPLSIEAFSYSLSFPGWVAHSDQADFGIGKFLEQTDPILNRSVNKYRSGLVQSDRLLNLHQQPPPRNFCDVIFGRH